MSVLLVFFNIYIQNNYLILHLSSQILNINIIQMLSKQKLKGFQYEFTVSVQEGVINVKFPCTFSLAWKVDKTTIEDPAKVSMINNKIIFDKELKSPPIKIGYNEAKQKYYQKKTTLCVNLNSFTKPNETKLAGVINLELTQFINQQALGLKKFKRFELQRCPDKMSYLMIWVKAQMKKELNKDQLSDSSFSQRKKNNFQSKSSISRSLISSFQKQDKSKYESLQKEISKPITHQTRSPLKKSYFRGEKTMAFFLKEEDQIEEQNSKYNDKIKSSPTFDRDMQKEYDRLLNQSNKLKLLNENLQGKLYTIEKKLVMGRSQQNNKVIQLAKENQNLRKQLLEKKIQFISIKEQKSSQQSEKKEIQTGIINERLIKIKQMHEEEIKKMTKIKQEYQNQIKKLKQEIASLKNLQEVSSNQIAQLNKKIQNLTNEIYNAKQYLQQQEHIIQQYQQTLLKYKTKQYQMQYNFAAIQQECLNMINQLKQKQSNEQKLYQKITQLEHLNSLSGSKKNQKQIIKLEALQEKIKVLQEQNQRLCNNNDLLTKQVARCKKSIKQFDAIQKSRYESLITSRTISEINENYQKRKVSKRERIKELQNTKRELFQKLQQMYLQIIKLNQKLYESNTQIKNQRQQINFQKQKIQILVKQLDTLKIKNLSEQSTFSIQSNKVGKITEIQIKPKKINKVHQNSQKEDNFIQQELVKQRQKNLEHQRRLKEMLVYIQQLRNQQLKLDEKLILRQSQIQNIKQRSSSLLSLSKNGSSNRQEESQILIKLIQELNNKISELSRIEKNLKQFSIPVDKNPVVINIGAASIIRQLSLEFAKLKMKKLQKVYDLNQKRNIIQQFNPIQRKIEYLESKIWN